MKRQAWLFVAVVLAQLVALGAIIVKREHLLRTGAIVRLGCRPVDPRSLLSGDYVELSYLISELGGEELRRLNRGRESFERGDTVYLAMTSGPADGVHRPVAISKRRDVLQGQGVLLRGTVRSDFGGALTIRYGVEQYFVPQDEGLRIERKLGDTVVEVAVSESSGESAIRRLFIAGEEVVFY